MFGNDDIKRIEQKIDELTEKVRVISERQNTQYTDIMMILNKSEIVEEIDDYPKEELYEKVKAHIIKVGRVSTSYLQRKFELGYARAARLMDLLEERGVISEGRGAEPREVFSKSEEK